MRSVAEFNCRKYQFRHICKSDLISFHYCCFRPKIVLVLGLTNPMVIECKQFSDFLDYSSPNSPGKLYSVLKSFYVCVLVRDGDDFIVERIKKTLRYFLRNFSLVFAKYRTIVKTNENNSNKINSILFV